MRPMKPRIADSSQQILVKLIQHMRHTNDVIQDHSGDLKTVVVEPACSDVQALAVGEH